ncbi:MAG: DNA mismatch repair protein MutL, partial [Oscillospiraceae bacterium]|nr:DNA mismatch repair protein MutL [Oscillospiraceae bacterium]
DGKEETVIKINLDGNVYHTDNKDKVFEQEENLNKAQETEIRIVGEAYKTYIIAEFSNKLIIIDKHAAHERMIYEQLKNNEAKPDTQLLLSPVSVTLSKEEYSIILENKELLSESGFEIDDFGVGSIVVHECPQQLSLQDIEQMVQELAGYLLSNREPFVQQLDWIYHSTACRAAIKAGDKTSDYELAYFVQKLLSNDKIRYCPHGRPVYIELTKSEIQKQFGRS